MSQPKSLLRRLAEPPQHVPNIVRELLEPQKLPETKIGKLLSDEQVPLTMEKAAWYIDLPTFEGERLLSDRHVQFLYDEMTKGTFNPRLVILATAKLGPVTYKVNGQHTCWAKAFLTNYNPTVRELTYEVANREQLKALYAQFDRGKTRTEAHLVRMFMADSELTEIGSWILQKLIQGLQFWLYPKRTEQGRRVKANDLSALIQDRYLGLFRQVASLITTNQQRHLCRAPVLAAMMATAEVIPGLEWEEFWTVIRDGTGLSAKDDPRLTLYRYLLSTSLGARGNKDKIGSQEEMFNNCINAWNKARAKQPLSVFKPMKERPTPQ